MSARSIDLDLSDNANLWGSPPSAVEMLRGTASLVSRYPELGADSLRRALARELGHSPTQVVVGCGSDDVLDAAFRALARPGDRIAHAAPTFGMVAAFARTNRLEPIGVPLRADGATDVDALLATGAPLIYLASPNNPTGTMTPAREIQRLVERAPGCVILDEAYAEFADGPDWRVRAPAWDRVFVTRTFSKAWGLAGLRVGYGVGCARLVTAVGEALGPYKVNALAARAATAALERDGDWMRSRAVAAREARATLEAFLEGRRGVCLTASRANFVLVRLGDGVRATEIAERFAEHGIGVRAFPALPVVGDAIRITVGPAPVLDRVMRAAEGIWPCA